MKFISHENGEEILIIKDSKKCDGNVYIEEYDKLKKIKVQ